MDRLGVEPGDLHRAVESADWLLYCLAEIARLYGKFELIKNVEFLRKRVMNGIRAELVELHTIGRRREGEGSLPLLVRIHDDQVDPGDDRGAARTGQNRRGREQDKGTGDGEEVKRSGPGGYGSSSPYRERLWPRKPRPRMEGEADRGDPEPGRWAMDKPWPGWFRLADQLAGKGAGEGL